MDKKKEKQGVEALVSKLGCWSIIKEGESPDYVIQNKLTHDCVGVEVTEYYPNRTNGGNALVLLPGRDAEETKANMYRFFEKFELGYLRFVPHIDVNDLLLSCIKKKEEKLLVYRARENKCGEFWLLIVLNFYDDVMCDYIDSIQTAFDKIFVWEEPFRIRELNISNK